MLPRVLLRGRQGVRAVTQALPSILFVCVENSNRSQMAEGFARAHGQEVLNAYSAGSRPSGLVNPKAIAAMRERGIDLSTHRSKGLSELPALNWLWIITMGCGDSCPHLAVEHREDWDLPDPRNMSPTDFNNVRDEIESRVLRLIAQIKENAK